MAMFSWAAIARGADGICYFRWRTTISGQEQYWHGIINHDNVPRRRYREVAAMGQDVKRLSPVILGTEPVADVGIYWDYDQIWAQEFQKQNWDDSVTLNAVARDLSVALTGLGVDFGAWGPFHESLKRFKVLLCPPIYLTRPEVVKRLEAFARAGGTVVLMAGTGVKTLNNVCRMEPLPGAFRPLAGIKEVEEYDVILKDKEYHIQWGDTRFRAIRLREDLVPAKGAEVVARHDGTWFTGKPAVTRHRFGKGHVWYFGCHLSAADWQQILPRILKDTPASYTEALPEGIELCRRRGAGRTLTFLFNHTSQPATLTGTYLPKGQECLTGKRINGTLSLPPYGVAVVKS